jgi:Fe-S cluster assembly protein SufD
MTQLAGQPAVQRHQTALESGTTMKSVPVKFFAPALRQQGKDLVEKLGWSPLKTEEWKFTSFREVVETQYVSPGTVTREHVEALVAPHAFKDAAAEIVIANGQFIPQLSKLPTDTKLVVMPLSQAATGEHAKLVEQHLGQIVRDPSNPAFANPFLAKANSAFEDGIFILVKKSAAIEKPIHLIFASIAESSPVVNYPRVLIIAQDNAIASVVESHIGTAHGKYLTNIVTELFAGQDANLTHYKIQQESLDAVHVATFDAKIGRSSKLVTYSCSIGAKLTRNDLNIKLDGQYASATLNGLVLVGGNQHVDNHTFLEHAHPDCPSYELYKHVLDQNASAVFKGKIFVHDVAQKTDAKQQSKTLLLTNSAKMNAMPALEIYADDVKCTHGSTTGPLDEGMIFYLQSRGVSRDQAQRLLTYAFLADVTRRIAVDPVRQLLEAHMAKQHDLPMDFRIQELGGHDDDVVY